ncbi:MAG: peptidase [Clostridia bacterium]|nr:peptidase [Clostridia bacterium]
MRMIFIFIDGFGIGEDNAGRNPLCSANAPAIGRLYREFTMIPTDACLGIPGLPQSATGQTAIFTGVNAPMVLNRHINGQPTVTLKKIINRNNLFLELKKMGLSITNANVYRNEYLQKMMNPADRRHRPSVTSVMTMSAGIKFLTVEDYKKGKGVYHDITGQILKDSGYEVDIIAPEEAARRLVNISRESDFTLYEHFMTDIIGHKMDMELAVKEIELLDAFLGEVLRLVNLTEDVVIITSDHGNIEDVSVKTHTFNKVPTFLLGNMCENSEKGIHSLVDIMHVVLDIFRKQRG